MRDFIDFAVLILILAAVMSVLIGVANFATSLGCHAEWRDSGFPVRYNLLGGCRIQIDGKWIPASKYRELTK